jgi:hypothetical protein
MVFSALPLNLIGQSAADGRVVGNQYVNSYFHFSYTLPPGMRARDPASLQIAGTPSKNEFLMFSAQEGEKPYGIVVLAEKLGPRPGATHPIRDADDFLNRVVAGWGSDASGKVMSRTRKTGPNGLQFTELDYLQSDEYDSAIALSIEGYLIVFRCNAESSEQLAKMARSVVNSRTITEGDKK